MLLDPVLRLSVEPWFIQRVIDVDLISYFLDGRYLQQVNDDIL